MLGASSRNSRNSLLQRVTSSGAFPVLSEPLAAVSLACFLLWGFSGALQYSCYNYLWRLQLYFRLRLCRQLLRVMTSEGRCFGACRSRDSCANREAFVFFACSKVRDNPGLSEDCKKQKQNVCMDYINHVILSLEFC